MPEATPSQTASQERNSGTGLIKRDWLILGAVALVAFLIRVIYDAQARGASPIYDMPAMDAGMHHYWAKKIAAGEGYGPEPYFRAPLYYYLLAGVFKVFGSSLVAARVLQALVGAGTCVLIGLLGHRLGGKAVGMVAASLAALYWPFVYFDGELLTTNLEVFLNTAFLLMCLRAADTGKPRDAAVTGILLGLAALARPNILVFAPVAMVWLWMRLRKQGQSPRPLLAPLVFLVATGLAIAPVTIRNIVVGKEPVLIATSGGVNFYIGNNPQADGFTAIVPGTSPTWQGGYDDTHSIVKEHLKREPTEREVSSYWTQKGLEWIKSNPGDWFRLAVEKLRLTWHVMEIPNNQPDEFFFARTGIGKLLLPFGFVLIGSLAVIGLFLIKDKKTDWTLPIAYFVVYTLTLVAFFVNGRFRQPMMPVLMLLSATSLVTIYNGLKGGRLLQALWPAVGALVVGAGLFAISHDLQQHQRFAEAEGHFILGNGALDKQTEEKTKYLEAAENFRRAVKLRPEDGEAWFRLAYSLSHADEKEEAKAALGQAVKILGSDQRVLALARRLELSSSEADAQTLNSQAIQFAKEGKTEEAVELWEKASKLDPKNEQYLNNLGVAYRNLKKPVEAAKAMEALLRLQPGRSSTALTLAHLYATSSDPSARNGKRSLELVQGLLKTASSNPLVLDVLACAHAENGSWAEAKKAISDAEKSASGGTPDVVDRVKRHAQSIRSEKPIRE